MARPSKCRKIGVLPKIKGVEPIVEDLSLKNNNPVLLTLDEYETIRLIDKIGLSQEECSKFMEVARTTIQAIYNEARKKIAIALVEVRPLQIEGGNYEVSQDCNHKINCYACYKYKTELKKRGKDEVTMKILLPVNKDKTIIDEHFSRAPYFMIYDSKTKSIKYIENPAKNDESGAGLRAAQCILDEGVEVVIVNRCGKNAAEVLEAGEIKLLQAVGNNIEENISKYQNSELLKLINVHGGFHGNIVSKNS